MNKCEICNKELKEKENKLCVKCRKIVHGGF